MVYRVLLEAVSIDRKLSKLERTALSVAGRPVASGAIARRNDKGDLMIWVPDEEDLAGRYKNTGIRVGHKMEAL